jgi:hypothetical protein
METKFLALSEHDSWNRFVDDSPQGDVFCYTWWLDAVTKDDFKILAVWENNQIVAGIILPFYGAGRINEPYLTRTIGVLYKRPGRESPRKRLSMERKWLNALLDHVDINHFVQMCMHHNFKDWLPFRWRGYCQTTRYTYILDYEKSHIDDIWRNVAKDQKEVIRKALRNNIHVEETDDITLAYTYSCLSFERQNKKFPYSLGDLKRLDEAIEKEGKRVIFKSVDAQQNIHAVFYVVYNEKSAYCLLSGGDPLLRSQGGHTLIIWEVIRYFSDKVRILNFGGSDIRPIEEHLRSFGGVQTQYFHIFNEALVLNREGLRHHGARLLYHGREALKGLRQKPLKEYLILFRKMVARLSDRKAK